MKKTTLFLSSLLIIMLLISCGGKSNSNSQNVEEKSSTKAEIEEPSQEEANDEPSIEYKIGQKITAHVYESNENGLKTYLHFESSEGCHGVCGSLTLSNNASDCKYVYTYSVTDNKIKAEFYGSDCGSSSSDQIFTYHEETNTLSVDINGQKFEFESIF